MRQINWGEKNEWYKRKKYLILHLITQTSLTQKNDFLPSDWIMAQHNFQQNIFNDLSAFRQRQIIVNVWVKSVEPGLSWDLLFSWNKITFLLFP